MKKLLLLGLVAFNLITELRAQSASQEVPGVMFSFKNHIEDLQPYMVSVEKFLDKKNQKTIENLLSELVKLSSALDSHHRLKTPGFQVSTKAIQDHLRLTDSVFKKGDKQYARRLLNATLDGCSSCHTQVQKKGLPTWSFDPKKVQGTAFDKAEFWFAVRNYEEALNLYDHFISSYPANKVDLSQLEASFRRKLTIHLRIQRSIPQALASLQQSFENKAIPPAIRLKVVNWIDQLKNLSKSKISYQNR